MKRILDIMAETLGPKGIDVRRTRETGDIRHCCHCGVPVLRMIGPWHSGSYELLPAATKIGGSKSNPHGYACDACRDR